MLISVFNGFAIYKNNKFKNFTYNGSWLETKDVFSTSELEDEIKFLKAKYNKSYVIRHGVECCEHLHYNLSAYKNGRIIKISKLKVFR